MLAVTYLAEPTRYDQEWHALTASHRRLTAALVTATRVWWARRLLVPAAARLPGVFEAAVAGLATPRTPRPPGRTRSPAPAPEEVTVP